MTKFVSNDYFKLTKDYLKNYRLYKKAVENLEQSMQDLRQELNSAPVQIAMYGADVKGGVRELTCTERAAQKRMELEMACTEMADAQQKLSRLCMRLERAINSLTSDERNAVQLFYVDRVGYTEMARICCYSESSCKRRVKRATQAIAVLLFGARAKPSLLFIE